MVSTEERLNKIEARITEKDFLKNKGLGNEVGYYIFAYPAADELTVRSHVSFLRKKHEQHHSPKIIEFDLYNLTIELLSQNGYLHKCFSFEKTKGLDFTFEAIGSFLRLTSKENRLIRHIVDNTSVGSVVFLTGVGKCFPFIRAHNILNNLHQVLDHSPVVLFFPGDWDGQTLHLFGALHDDNYYRAFPLI